ncbi:MAG: hypothetical protein DRQ44_05825, partial [Gammaproteobacteria bacterium]
MQTNSNISYTGLVEKYVGTAYDKMALISDNMDELLKLTDELEEGNLDDLLESMPDVLEAITKIDEFNDMYYGPLLEEPATKPSGAATLAGDIYLNTTENVLYVYYSDAWVKTGVAEGTSLEVWEYTTINPSEQIISL